MNKKKENRDSIPDHLMGIISSYREINYVTPIIVLENPKTDLYKQIKELIMGENLLWHHSKITTSNPVDKLHEPKTNEEYSNAPFFAHCIIERPNPKSQYPKNTSYITEQAINCVNEIFDYNQIKLSNIFRMNINMTYYTKSSLYTMPHIDHDFPHNNMLIYFNEVSGGEVKVYKNDKWHIHKPKEDDVILFSGLHCHRTPQKPEEFRTALVTTFI